MNPCKSTAVSGLLAFAVVLIPTGASAQDAPIAFASRWTVEPVERMESGTALKEGMSLLKFRLLPDSIYQLSRPFVSAGGKWKLAAMAELDGLVSDAPVACSQIQKRKAKYSIFDGSYFESRNICLVDTDKDGAFDKSFETSGFGLRWRTFEQEVNDSRSNDNRMVLQGTVPANAVAIDPLRYSKLDGRNSANILYLNLFYAQDNSLVGEYSLGFCIDYKALEKSCNSLRPMTFLKSFKKSDVPTRITMIGSEFTILRAERGTLQISFDRVPDRHEIHIISNPFDIE